MARNQIICDAPAERVFSVLADPRPYAYFVVGTRKIRRFHPRWPEPGTALHHSLGLGLTVIRDTTETLESDPPRRLVLRPNLRPLSINETRFELTPQGEGRTRVEIEEVAVDGPAARGRVKPVVDRLLWARNVLLLRRLRKLAEDRERQWRSWRSRTNSSDTNVASSELGP